MNTTTFSLFFYSHDVKLTIGAFLISFTLSFPLNVYVMYLILKGSRETLPSDFFMLNLTVSEILFTTSGVWYYLAVGLQSMTCVNAFMFSRGLLFTGRPLFLCFMCVEYYLGVVHPVLFLEFKPLRYRVACCCIAWLLILMSCLFSLYTYLDGMHLYGFFIQNILVFSVMLFCCCSVLRALKHPGPGEKNTEKKGNTMKRRAFKILLVIVISLVLNFFLYTFVIPLQYCLPIYKFTTVYTICVCIALATGFLQPLLYLQRNGKLPCFKDP